MTEQSFHENHEMIISSFTGRTVSHTHIPASKGSKYLHPVRIMVNEKFGGPLGTDKLSSLTEWKEEKQIPVVPSPS